MLVVLAHPYEHAGEFLVIPRQIPKSRQHLAHLAVTVPDVVVHSSTRGIRSLNRKYGETHLFNEKPKQSMLDLEELPGPVIGLAQPDDEGAMERCGESPEVISITAGVDLTQWNGMLPQPIDNDTLISPTVN